MPPSLSASRRVRSNVKVFPDPEGPIWIEFAGSALNGGFGCLVLGSWPVLRGRTSGIYLWAFTRQLQHQPSQPLSMVTSKSLPWSCIVSCVATSQSHPPSSSQHLEAQEASLQTYLAQSVQERLRKTLATSPMYPLLLLYNLYKTFLPLATLLSNYSKSSTVVSRISRTLSYCAIKWHLEGRCAAVVPKPAIFKKIVEVLLRLVPELAKCAIFSVSTAIE